MFSDQLFDLLASLRRLALLIVMLLLLIFASSAMAQEKPFPADFAALGVGWNQYASPQISGNLLYAHLIDGGTYSFTSVDVLSRQTTPFSVATSISTGLAQHLRTIGPARVFIVSTVGVIAGGQEGGVGYSWTGGGCLAFPLGRGFHLLPSVRVIKFSGGDFQAIYDFRIGWGR